jgi:hypothetical protein
MTRPAGGPSESASYCCGPADYLHERIGRIAFTGAEMATFPVLGSSVLVPGLITPWLESTDDEI